MARAKLRVGALCPTVGPNASLAWSRGDKQIHRCARDDITTGKVGACLPQQAGRCKLVFNSLKNRCYSKVGATKFSEYVKEKEQEANHDSCKTNRPQEPRNMFSLFLALLPDDKSSRIQEAPKTDEKAQQQDGPSRNEELEG